ncbi:MULTISPECIES: response regulator [unclassified Pseudoalteromonas]|uniref:response regulator n=1 Tax=unclassified Pseudoalteromonas TaxID=194690 RepID=UPI0013FDBA0F|nr:MULTISPECIES: response regulator [unclassified Pseudoalteromonas]MBH0030654.1 response regulator [Pseudoalteromonas sp. SWYJZ98]
MLKNENIKIDYACSAIEAMLMVSQNSYDIILMDIVMPQFTGTDAMLKIRKHADASATKIIAHTFSENENSDNKYVKLGFNGLLLKPVKQSVLIENIRYFLE